MKSLLFIFLFSMARLPVFSESGGQGPIAAPEGEQSISVCSAQVLALPARNFDHFKPPPSAIGRTHWKLDPKELLELDNQSISSGSLSISDGGTGFDLWDAVSALHAAPGSDLLFQFTVTSSVDRSVILGIGCDDAAIVSDGTQIVFATMGTREFIRNQDLIPLHLRPGSNRFYILCHKWVKWLASEGRRQLEWKTSVDLFASNEVAWREFRRRNFHLCDVNILNRIDDIRIESFLPGCNSVSLVDVAGKILNQGKIMESGRIVWISPPPGGPFLGFITVADHDADALLVTSGEPLEGLCQKWTSRLTSEQEQDPWLQRLRHLLNLRFNASRNDWWTRKVVLSLVMALTRQGESCPSQVFSGYLPGKMRFGSYVSRIDGMRQYYRLFIPTNSSSARIPLIAIIPSVGSQVRPFLESVAIANLRESEDVSDIAESRHMCVLWPGLVDLDYGGNFARAQLDECLAAVEAELPFAETYLLGTCSSGVAALGYAETRTVKGLVLQSPVVARNISRWLKGIDVDEVLYPRAVLDEEQTVENLNELATTPVLLVYNKEIPGHGDKKESIWLCSQLKRIGAPIEQRWPAPINDYLWGENARTQLEGIFDWIRDDWKRKRTVANYHPTFPESRTVKGALLQGFSIITSGDKDLDAWLIRWRSLWESLRGGVGRPSNPSVSDNRTVITGRVLLQGDFEQLRSITVSNTFFSTTTQRETITGNDELWGFRLLPQGQTPRVEIFRSINAHGDFPKMELVTDGCCQGALWKYSSHGWNLVGIWL